MKSLHFTGNDNNRLYCSSFMHVDIRLPEKYEVDHGYDIYLHGAFLGHAKIIERRNLKVRDISKSLATIVTGYSREVLIAELASKYTIEPVTNDTKIYCICFKYLKYGNSHPLFGSKPSQTRRGKKEVRQNGQEGGIQTTIRV